MQKGLELRDKFTGIYEEESNRFEVDLKVATKERLRKIFIDGMIAYIASEELRIF